MTQPVQCCCWSMSLKQRQDLVIPMQNEYLTEPCVYRRQSQNCLKQSLVTPFLFVHNNINAKYVINRQVGILAPLLFYYPLFLREYIISVCFVE